MHVRSILIFFLVFSSSVLLAQKKADTLFRGTSRFIEKITITDKNKKTVIQYSNQNKIVFRENYVDDKLHGLKSAYNNYNGNLEEETEYKNGRKNGSSKEYSSNGIIRSSSEYKNDTLQGVQIKYYDIGTIQSKETYVKGIKLGKSEYYFKSGNPSAKYTNDTTMVAYGKNKEKKVTQVSSGSKQTWYESGFKKEEENYIKGQKKGTFKGWYENGKLKFVNNYVNDVRTGHQLSYHQNGNLQEDITIETEYDSIKKYNKTFYIGKYLKFDEAGNPVVKGYYKGREKNGVWQEYNNGKLYTDSEYKNGYPVGTLKVYHNGTTQLNRISQYKEINKNAKDTSCLDGESIVYYVTGNLAQKQLYKDCKCLSNIVYHENGSISNQQEVKDSMVYSTSYHKNGKKSGRSVAKYDPAKDITNLKFEQIESYYENGQLRQNFSNMLNPLRIKKEYNDSGLVIFRKYNISNEIGIETEYYPGGALRSESVHFTSYYKTPGLQYLEWLE
ncbi:MAG: toxin-antitoxin system YwqK family antitoxin, partial [Bacteroidetes bacterium]|nr:toxin-antitoxin system YwqK family antitoxin [Bacteroidota bacterium]